METSKVFQWARAVLSPQFLSQIPSVIDCGVLLSEVTDGLQLGLTTDLSTGVSCLALQGKWENILQAQIKLTELLTKWQEGNQCNEKISSSIETSVKGDSDNLLNHIGSRKFIKFEEDVAKLSKDPVGKVYQSSETTFSKNNQDIPISKTKSLQKDSVSVVDVISKEGQLNQDVRKVFVLSDNCTQLDLLPSLNCHVPSDSQDTLNSSQEDENISVAVDSSSQLIIVTNSVDDSKAENVVEQKDDKGEELYMNIVLSSKKDYNASLTDTDLKQTVKMENGSRENPLDKLCQLLKIDEEESASEIIDKKNNEFEKKRRYEENMPFKYFCTNCSFKSKRENQYLRHVKLHEKHRVIYHCGRCQFKTIRIATLRRHEIQHNENHIINCAKCPYKTDSLEFLKKHIQTKHSSNKPAYQCGQCDFKVDSLRLLKRHKYEHFTVKPKKFWSCSLCSYKTQNKGHLQRHKNDVHELIRSYLCHHCGKSFKRHDALKQHKITHGESGPTYSCSICNKLCHSAAHLKEHMTVHSTQRPFLCELCGSTFKTLSIQRKHVKMIHNTTRYVACPQCKRIFSNKVTMARHQKTHCSKDNGTDNTACDTSKCELK